MSERPVKCFCCKKPMYYFGNKEWTPEVRIDIVQNYKEMERFYLHEDCWNYLKRLIVHFT